MMRRIVMVLVAVLALHSPCFAQTFGVKKRTPRPEEFGNVLMNNFAESSRTPIAPVVFKHWVHRTKYTCRLCHVDIGFSMNANGTQVHEADNEGGMYCGTCHNGKEAFGPRGKDEAGKAVENCSRCHSSGKAVEFKYVFAKTIEGYPKSRFGNRVDWMAAEEKGLFKLKDQLEGLSIKRKDLKIPVDESIKSKEIGMPEIIFSHAKHSVWNGCELCHPDLFGVEKGKTKYTMQDIFDGKFCGACHGSVAFSNLDCQLCHLKEVQ